MTRTYRSRRRAEQAKETRRRILDAAVGLHRRGITAYGPLAEAAGVSPATVRLHFPDREAIFRGCTAHFLASFEPPRLEVAARLADPGERVRSVASEMCRAHEETSDLLWYARPHAETSEALRAATDAFAQMAADAAAAIVDGPGLDLAPGEREAAGVRLRALLDPLTYRAFRVEAGFDADATRRELTALLRAALRIPPTC